MCERESCAVLSGVIILVECRSSLDGGIILSLFLLLYIGKEAPFACIVKGYVGWGRY